MANNEQKTVTKLTIFFRLLPVLGILLILGGGIAAFYQEGFKNVLVIGAIGLGILLFLTMFLKAEAANIKYYLNVFVYSAAVMAICVVGYMFARNYTKQIDLTKQKYFSLSEESTNLLNGLKKDEVEIAFFAADSRMFQPLADIYDSHGKKIKWTFLDATKDPIATRSYGDNINNGTMVVRAGKKSKKLQISEIGNNYENTITNAIVEVTRQKEIKIYFTTGHGEVAYAASEEAPSRSRMSRQTSEPSLKAFRDFLSQRALQTDQLNLVQTGAVPQDATMVVIAGPTADVQPAEVAALQKYLSADGKLLVLLDVPKSNFAAPLKNLQDLLKTYGVDTPDKLVLDLAGNQLFGRATRPVITEMDPEHPITHDLSGRMVNLFLGMTRPISPAAENPAGYKVTELLKSSPYSWSEDMSKVLASGGKLTPPEQKAPQSLGVAVSPAAPPARPGMPPPPEPKGGVRLVVYGTSELIQDNFLMSYPAAAQVMLNTVNWLAQQEDLIAVPPRQIEGTPIHLTNGELWLIFFLSVILIPATLFFGGITYTLQRRRR